MGAGSKEADKFGCACGFASFCAFHATRRFVFEKSCAREARSGKVYREGPGLCREEKGVTVFFGGDMETAFFHFCLSSLHINLGKLQYHLLINQRVSTRSNHISKNFSPLRPVTVVLHITITMIIVLLRPSYFHKTCFGEGVHWKLNETRRAS